MKDGNCKVRVFAPQYDDVNQILVSSKNNWFLLSEFACFQVRRSNGSKYTKVAYDSSNLIQFKVERGTLFSLSFVHSNHKVGPPSHFFNCELPGNF